MDQQPSDGQDDDCGEGNAAGGLRAVPTEVFDVVVVEIRHGIEWEAHCHRQDERASERYIPAVEDA